MVCRVAGGVTWCAVLQEELDRKTAEEEKANRSKEEKEKDAEENEGESCVETQKAGDGRKRAAGKAKQLEVGQ